METKICPKCGIETNNFSPKVKVCRICKKKSNDVTNIEMLSDRSSAYGKKYPDIKNANIVYEFYYDDGSSAYIGETKNGSYRIWEHYNDKVKSFCKYLTKEERKAIFNYRELWSGDNDLKRKMMETSFIKAKQPQFNTVYK